MITAPAEAPSRPADSASLKNPLLLLVAMVALTGGFLFGYDTAVVNGANQYLTKYFNLSTTQEGIAAASAILGCIPGAMFAGMVSDRFGRRRMLFICAILFAVSGILSAVPRTFGEFLAVRLISGLAIGACSMICPVYVAEMAPARWRGLFGTMFQLGIVTGIFLTLFVNGYIQGQGDEAWNISKGWRWMLGAEVVPAIVLLILLFPVKESPRWLQQVGRESEARGVLLKLLGASEAEVEIQATREVLKASEGSFMDLLSSSRFRHLLLIAIVLMTVSQFCGINAIMYYSTSIFTSAGIGVKDAFAASAVVGLVNLLFTLIAVALVDKAGRRGLLLVGLTAQVIALCAVGWMFQQGSSGVALLIGILAFIGAFAMAMGPIPWILCSEIFPARVRGRAMSVATFTIWLACYIVAATFPKLNQALGAAKTFWIYGTCSLLGLIFVWKMVPETKGRSLEEIEVLFSGKKN